MFRFTSRPSRRFFAVVAMAALISLGAAGAAQAASVSLTSTVNSSGFNGGTTASFPLTADGSYLPENTPWSYDSELVAALEEIETISVNLILGSAEEQRTCYCVNPDRLALLKRLVEAL